MAIDLVLGGYNTPDPWILVALAELKGRAALYDLRCLLLFRC